MTLITAPSKEALLRAWMQERQVFATHEVIQWGLDNFYVRANRTKEQLRHNGVIRKLTREEAVLVGYDTKQGVYAWVQADGA